MFDDQIIPKIKFNPEKAYMSSIAHDFHYMNKEGEFTLPWFNQDAMQKRNVSQKNVFTFTTSSDYHNINAVDQVNSDTPIPLEATAEQELVSLSGHNLEMEEILEDNLELDNAIVLNKDTIASKKTIKIPSSTFAKIHNFRYPPISIEANTDIVPPKSEATVEQDLVSLSGHNPEMEDIIEENLEIGNANVLNKNVVLSKKTIKIPFSTLAKIHNFRYPPISTGANTDSVPQEEFTAEQELVPLAVHNPEMKDIIEENLRNDNANVLKKDTVVSKKIIKIPFSTFTKIHNFRYPPISIEANTDIVPQKEDTAEQELVSLSEHNPEMKDIFEDNLEMDNANVFNKDIVVSKKTIKIAFSTFTKIHNFCYPPISTEVNTDNVAQIETAVEQELVSLSANNPEKEDILEDKMEATAEQGGVSQSEHNPEMEDILGLADNLEVDSANVLNKHTIVSKKTIKIPFTTFAKIHYLRYSAISIEAHTDSVPQKEFAAEQELVSLSANNPEKEDILEVKMEATAEQGGVSQSEHNPEMEAAAEQGGVSQSEHNPEMEATAEHEVIPQSEHNSEIEDILEDNLEIDNANVLNKDTVVRKKTIKIPFSTFAKIHSLRYPAISIEAHTDSVPQKEFAAEQELMSLSANNPEKEDILEDKMEATAEQGGVSQSEHNPEMEDILGLADNLEIDSANVLNKHTIVSKKTIKIPFTTFAKIHYLRYPAISIEANTYNVPQIEDTAERGGVSQSEHNPEMEATAEHEVIPKSEHIPEKEETLEVNLEIDNANVLNKDTVVRKKTIKIPFSTFVKIHNLRYPGISIEANTDSAPQKEFAAEQELVSLSANNPEEEDILEDKMEATAEHEVIPQSEHTSEMEGTLEVNLESDNANELNKDTVVRKKTIKIPFSTFVKIHNLRYPPISIEANTESAPQKEAAVEQELVSLSANNPEKGDILEDKMEATAEHEVIPQSEHIPEKEETLEVNLENDNANVLNNHTVSKKTIKIPLSALTKIHNSRSPIERESATLVDFPKHNIEMEDILELNTTENNLKINHVNEPDKHTKIRKKTIKIPLTVFRKIHNIHYSSSLPNANSGNDLQPETVTDQSENNLEKEGMIALDAAVDNSNDENKHKIENNDNVDIKHSINLNGHTMVRSKTIKIPISTFAEVDNFHHPPVFGSTFQNTFKFIDPSDHKSPQLETDLFDTITYFHEQPYCHLVGFKSHEMIFSTDLKRVDRENMKEQKVYNRAVVVPIHDNSRKTGETNNVYPNHKYVNTRVPVVVGEYNLEVCLDEDVLFEEKVNKVKEISKVVELTNCKFVPTRFAPSPADERRIALKGKLFIEGNIYQSIEYIADANIDKNTNSVKQEQIFHPLHQKIVMELIIQLLQVQTVSTVINQQLT
ncbi:BC_2427 family protein [Psychrobacillus sp. OK032]|uniref:BC_2427 family protein n=1 Tax=Psychrobacillus sp. OK032 TaxID=1884358 RepID=UPI0008BAB5E7|nr:hypothetical protein [Psychrobacillus sp. OK032]SES33169.1 hypothetical protein SAMN05518872_10812 [Psychrobacillus sp. OK032]